MIFYKDISLRVGDRVLVETEWGEGVGKVFPPVNFTLLKN